jgi:hypothetical protein
MRSGNLDLLAAYALVIGACVFGVGIVVHGRLRAGYTPVRNYVCELIVGPGAWVQRANFVVFGVLQVLFAVVSTQRIGSGPGARAGSVMLACIGLSLIATAIFPTERKPLSMMRPTELTHMAFAIVAFSLVPVAMLAFAADFARSSAWQWLAPGSRVTAVVTTLMVIVSLAPLTRDPILLRTADTWVRGSGRGGDPNSGARRILALHSSGAQFVGQHAGLLERLMLALFIGWEVVIALSMAATGAAR